MHVIGARPCASQFAPHIVREKNPSRRRAAQAQAGQCLTHNAGDADRGHKARDAALRSSIMKPILLWRKPDLRSLESEKTKPCREGQPSALPWQRTTAKPI